jgi:hypothetical protein
VDKIRVLCAMSGATMKEFSTRTAVRLGDYTLFRLMLPPFQAFLDINVGKEVEKNRLVIRRAGFAQRARRTPQESDIRWLLQQARDIDRTFLQQAVPFPINIHIEYRDIDRLRTRRIERLLELAGQLLSEWEVTPRFRTAVARLYSRAEFESLVREILELYCTETRMLSHSVHLPRIFDSTRDSLAETVYSVMVTVARELAGELTDTVYRRPDTSA